MDGYEPGNDFVSCHFSMLTNPLFLFLKILADKGSPAEAFLSGEKHVLGFGKHAFSECCNCLAVSGVPGPHVKIVDFVMFGFKSDR